MRRPPDRLVGSTKWVEYDGASNHHKILDRDANFEEFDVRNAGGGHLKVQTLRLYNPQNHQWSIYLRDVNNGKLGLPPVVGEFNGGPSTASLGEFYDQETWNGHAILVCYQRFNLLPTSSRMEQSSSADGGKTWETNWICELTCASPAAVRRKH